MKKLLILLSISLLFTGCGLIPGEEGGEGPNDQVYTTAQKEFAAEELFKQGKFEEAITAYESILDESDASDKSTIIWAMLKLSSISVSDDVRIVASNLGIQNYPTTINELIAGANDLDTTSAFPSIDNTDRFTDIYGGSIVPPSMLALLYNMQESYPDGLDPIMDSFISATSVMDVVIAKLVSLDDNTSFDLEVSMFEDGVFDSYSSSWPTDKNGNAEVVTLGKAEVYLSAAILEGVRASVYAANSISLTIDLDGYWDIFDPIEGSFYTFDQETGYISGFNENFDWSTMQDPVKYGLFSESDDAEEVLAEAKEHFTDAFKYIKEAGDLLASRTSADDFYISPSNEMIDSADWEKVVEINGAVGVVCDKVIYSLEHNSMLYIPIPNPEYQSEEDYIISLGNPANWPTGSEEGSKGVNLGQMFEKPIFAIENIIELDNERGFVLYEYDEESKTATTGEPATTYVDGSTYALKIVDTTLNGVLSDNLSAMIPEYLPVNPFFAGHELTAQGETFTIEGEEFVADGSVFHYVSLLSRQTEYSEDSEQVSPDEGNSSDTDEVGPGEGDSSDSGEVNFSFVEGQYLYLESIEFFELDHTLIDYNPYEGAEINVENYFYFVDGTFTIYYIVYYVNPETGESLEAFYYTDLTYTAEGDIIVINDEDHNFYISEDNGEVYLVIENEFVDAQDYDGDSDVEETLIGIHTLKIADPFTLPDFELAERM